MSIWQHDFAEKNNIPEAKRLTLNEGATPLTVMEIEGVKVAVKDENLNPNGSFKDRSLAYQTSYYLAQGKLNFTISSSGNAAISAAAYLSQIPEATLKIFVSQKINPAKLIKIQKFVNDQITVVQTDNAKSDAIKYASETSAVNLRGSVDDNAVIGFKTIAYEIAAEYPEIDAIFIPCSSGTSTLGIYQGFKERNLSPQIHIAQTTKINAIAKEFDNDFNVSETSLGDAIADRVAHRKNQIVDLIKNSNGSGWIISDAELESVKSVLNSNYSYNSLLGFAAYIKAVKAGRQFKHPLILASGL